MNADAELDAALGRHAGISLDHAVLHLDGAAHGVDHAAKLDDDAVPGALDDAPAMGGDGGVDQVAAQSPKPRKRAVLVRAREPAITDHVGDRKSPQIFLVSGKAGPRAALRLAQIPGGAAHLFAEAIRS